MYSDQGEGRDYDWGRLGIGWSEGGDVMVKVPPPPGRCPRPAPAPPQGAVDRSGWLGAPRGETGPLGAQPLPRVLPPPRSPISPLLAM